jgi:hypothetical protein
MADFDPNALVKAMGPQHDPYSWAERYGADASKQNQLLIELRNRMLAQEAQQQFTAGQNQLSREQTATLARERESGITTRHKEALKAGRYSPYGRSGGGIVILPQGAMEERSYNFQKMQGKIDPKDEHQPVQIGSVKWMVPKVGLPHIKSIRPGVDVGGDATTTAPATVRPPYDPEADLP